MDYYISSLCITIYRYFGLLYIAIFHYYYYLAMIIWQSPGELLANSWQSPGQLLEVPGQLLANSWQLLASSWQALEPLPEYITELPWTILVRILIGTLTRMPHRAQRSSERRADNTITKNNTFKQHVQTTRLRELIFVIVSFESVDYCYSSV